MGSAAGGGAPLREAPPGGLCLCLAAWCCPCIVVGQLWHRAVEAGSCNKVAMVLFVVAAVTWILQQVIMSLPFPQIHGLALVVELLDAASLLPYSRRPSRTGS